MLQHLWLGTFCVHLHLRNIYLLFRFISFPCFSHIGACRIVQELLLVAKELKQLLGLEEKSCVHVSVWVSSGSSLFRTLRP